MKGISLETLRQYLRYEPETGVFTWIRLDSKHSGKQAGTVQRKGYRIIEIYGTHLVAHRLAWFYVTGEWPKYQIDHINGNKDDNRFCNLREASNAENKRNGNARADSGSGLKGIIRDKRYSNRWGVKLQFAGDKRQTWCGTFNNLLDAIVCSNFNIAYGHGPFARLNQMPEGWSHD